LKSCVRCIAFAADTFSYFEIRGMTPDVTLVRYIQLHSEKEDICRGSLMH
jgi:hypothetical protein